MEPEGKDTISDGGGMQRPRFGSRFLTDASHVFQHNAWDHVEWTPAQEEDARRKVEEQAEEKLSVELQELYDDEASEFWNGFYKIHENRFFKDRNWLFTEFPELLGGGISHNIGVSCEAGFDRTAVPKEPLERLSGQNEFPERSDFPGSHTTLRIMEVGCGVGNTVFPILQTNSDREVFIYCCDFSSAAVDLVKAHPDYDPKRCHAFVHDLCTDKSYPMAGGSLDIIILIFVLSSINPDKVLAAVKRLTQLLRPGGLLLFRDYGRYDMAQLRFKKGRCIADNFYARGDGTRVYFFLPEEAANMFSQAGLVQEQHLVDRRLQVNRGRQVTMYRVWIQSKFRKPLCPPHSSDDHRLHVNSSISNSHGGTCTESANR
uniref:tRNA N(3)-methylcytidine methyltransferase METTL2-like isoform X2 n=1 Tax=Myxine glutinosa TaxID=7769 RepID=UPI00358F42F1